MNTDLMTLKSLHRIRNSEFQEIAQIQRIRGSVALISRYRPARFLPVPLFVHDERELVLISSEELLPVEDMEPVALSSRLIRTNRSLRADNYGSGIRARQYLCCRYTARIPSDNRSGLIRCLSTDEIPQSAQASFQMRRLRLPEASLLLSWLQRPLCNSGPYTFGDGFCGAGGASRGAALAGFRIAWGFDSDGTVGSSFRANFARSTTEDVVFYQIDAQNFTSIPQSEVYVDVLHLSPSCQAFSAANTVENGGRHGDYNRDSFLACLAIINHVRPRIVTLEQVPGLLYNRSQNYFDTFLRDLVDLGFSLTWQVLQSERYGVPQARKRLVLIAACPGHKLPSMPVPCDFVPVVNDFLPEAARRPEFDELWNGTIMTAGARRSDGSRLSNVELAAAQSFPIDHVFLGGLTAIRRQIGNAVPPQLARNFFAQIKSTLQVVDRGASSESHLIE